MLSAARFAATLTSKQQRCLPFTFDPTHRSALQAAVERRVFLSSTSSSSTTSSSDAPVAPLPAACSSASSADAVQPVSRLCDADIELLQSCLTMLQRWPCWMQQQWLAVSSRKIAKSEVCCFRRAACAMPREMCLSGAHAWICRCVSVCLCTVCLQICQLHEQAALYDFVRDVALRHHPPLGYAVCRAQQLHH
jgi:hypothetical protein